MLWWPLGKWRQWVYRTLNADDWTLLQSIMKTPLATNQIEMSVVENSAFTNGDLIFCRNLVCRPWLVPAGWRRIVPGGEPQASDFVSNDWCS